MACSCTGEGVFQPSSAAAWASCRQRPREVKALTASSLEVVTMRCLALQQGVSEAVCRGLRPLAVCQETALHL